MTRRFNRSPMLCATAALALRLCACVVEILTVGQSDPVTSTPDSKASDTSIDRPLNRCTRGPMSQVCHDPDLVLAHLLKPLALVVAHLHTPPRPITPSYRSPCCRVMTCTHAKPQTSPPQNHTILLACRSTSCTHGQPQTLITPAVWPQPSTLNPKLQPLNPAGGRAACGGGGLAVCLHPSRGRCARGGHHHPQGQAGRSARFAWYAAGPSWSPSGPDWLLFMPGCTEAPAAAVAAQCSTMHRPQQRLESRRHPHPGHTFTLGRAEFLECTWQRWLLLFCSVAVQECLVKPGGAVC